MERKNIKAVLKCPYKDILEYLLSLVSLTDKEKEMITQVDIKGYTEERTAEFLDMSVRWVKQQRHNAYEKLGKVWEDKKIVKYILDEK